METGAKHELCCNGPTPFYAADGISIYHGDCRDVMVEGPAGILAVSSSWCRPEYEPSKRRLTWPNGADFAPEFLHDNVRGCNREHR